MSEVLASIESEFRRYESLGRRALEQLGGEDLGRRPLGDGNSVAVLVWHVAGNLESRFTDFLSSDGEKAWRDRESEFGDRQVAPAEARAKWERGWSVLFATLRTLSEADLTRTVTIRGQALSVVEALHRSLAHASHHVGQIVLLARALRGAGWTYLSIPPGKSEEFNRKLAGGKDPERS